MHSLFCFSFCINFESYFPWTNLSTKIQTAMKSFHFQDRIRDVPQLTLLPLTNYLIIGCSPKHIHLRTPQYMLLALFLRNNWPNFHRFLRESWRHMDYCASLTIYLRYIWLTYNLTAWLYECVISITLYSFSPSSFVLQFFPSTKVFNNLQHICLSVLFLFKPSLRCIFLCLLRLFFYLIMLLKDNLTTFTFAIFLTSKLRRVNLFS